MTHANTQPTQLCKLNNGDKFTFGNEIFVVKERNFEHGYALVIPEKHYRKGKQRKHTSLMHLYKNVEQVIPQR